MVLVLESVKVIRSDFMSSTFITQLYIYGNLSLEFLIENIWKYVFVSLRTVKKVY